MVTGWKYHRVPVEPGRWQLGLPAAGRRRRRYSGWQFQHGVVDIAWSPAGGSLAVIGVVPNAPLSLSRGNAPAPTGQIEIASRLPCKLDDMRYTLGEAMHLFVVGAATGNTRPLTSAGAAE